MDLRGFLAHAEGDGFLATINEKGEVDVAPADQQDAALAEFRKQYQALHDGPNSLWREAAKEVQTVLATRLGLLPAEAKK